MTPSCWNRSPEDWVQGGSIPFKCIFFPSPSQVLCPRSRKSWSNWDSSASRESSAACVGGCGSDQGSLGCELRLFLPADHRPPLCCLHYRLTVVESFLGGGRTCTDSKHMVRDWLWWSSHWQGLGSSGDMAWGMPSMAGTTLPGPCPRTR